MKQPIKPEDIRKGDLIREEGIGYMAWEWRSRKYGYMDVPGRKYFLLDRPAQPLPTENGVYWVDGEHWLLDEGIWHSFDGSIVEEPSEYFAGVEDKIQALDFVSVTASEVLDIVSEFAWADGFTADIERLRKEYSA